MLFLARNPKPYVALEKESEYTNLGVQGTEDRWAREMGCCHPREAGCQGPDG